MTIPDGRYGVNPSFLRGQKDIISHIMDLADRIKSKESSLQIGHTAIEDGDLVVRNGNIIVSETDGTTVLEILHGAIPEIRMYPLGDTSTHKAAMFGVDFDIGFGPDQGVQLGIEFADNTNIDGGKVLLTKSYAIVSHQPDVGQETYIWLNADPSVDEIIRLRGRFRNQWQYDTHQAVYVGDFTASSGAATWTHTYAAPFASKAIPVFSVGVAGTTIQWGIESYSTSNFVIRFSTTTGNKLVTFIVVRTN